MIKANHTWLGVLFFRFYSRWRLHRNFLTINLRGQFNADGKSVLMIGNHFSWWDGFIQNYLNQKVVQRKFHVVMLEEQLKRNMILNKTGVFSIDKRGRKFVESLRYCIELLQTPENMVLIFPQGEIQTMHTRNFTFERGVEFILQHTEGSASVVFNVNLVDYFSKSKPSLTIYYKSYTPVYPIDIQLIERDYNDYVRECVDQQVEL